MRGMSHATLTATVWREDASYVSLCPELGVTSFGKTPEEAVEMLREAVELYLENAAELGIPSRPVTYQYGECLSDPPAVLHRVTLRGSLRAR